MSLILLGKHPTTGEKWWFPTGRGIVPFSDEEMAVKRAADKEYWEKMSWEIFNGALLDDPDREHSTPGSVKTPLE